MRPYKVRFHLAKGENYKKWQIKNTKTNEVTYIDPHKFWLILDDCKFRNQRGTARRIFNGENKTVCAWIECYHAEWVPVNVGDDPDSNFRRHQVLHSVSYNPRIHPFWASLHGENLDNYQATRVVSWGRELMSSDLYQMQ